MLVMRSATECKKHQEQKQAKARNLREKLLAEKADRLHMLTKKVCSVFTFGYLGVVFRLHLISAPALANQEFGHFSDIWPSPSLAKFLARFARFGR